VKDFQNFGNYDTLKDIQILTPTKKGDTGTKNLNKELQKVLNPKSPFKNEKEYGDVIFREGDKVMQVKNNYDTYWESIDGKAYGSGVFNGDLGIIRKIEEGNIQVIFDEEKVVNYDYGFLDELEHAYAITIHKSQGSEFPVVLIPIIKGPPMLLTRNLLYTAITRAKELLVIVGNESVVNYMVNNVNTKTRNTGLKFKLLKYMELFKE
jgi:exodeoxyribonuclease V alpha subunit